MHKAKVIKVGSHEDNTENHLISCTSDEKCYVYSTSNNKSDNTKSEKKNYSDELQALSILQDSRDENVSKAASIELANRIQWKTTPPACLDIPRQQCFFNNEKSYYICSYGGSGSKMLQAYLSNFGNTFHIHSRNPPKKLTRVGTEDHPEWFNNIELKPILDRQLPFNQIENIKVIFIYRNPIGAIHSRIIPRKTHRISTDHLNHIDSEHWNIESVVGNMMDLWKLEEFFDNYTIKDEERNYSIYCVNYDKFWDNIYSFNKIIDIPDIPSLYPIKKENEHDIVYEEELNVIYKNMIKKMDDFPPIFVV